MHQGKYALTSIVGMGMSLTMVNVELQSNSEVPWRPTLECYMTAGIQYFNIPTSVPALISYEHSNPIDSTTPTTIIITMIITIIITICRTIPLLIELNTFNNRKRRTQYPHISYFNVPSPQQQLPTARVITDSACNALTRCRAHYIYSTWTYYLALHSLQLVKHVNQAHLMYDHW